MSEVKRRQIQRAILQWLYEMLLQSASTWAQPQEGDIPGFDWKDVQYELRRLEGDGLIEGERLKRITAHGIEYLEELGGETILSGDLREIVLSALYEIDREEGPYAYTDAENLSQDLTVPESEIGVALHYLEDSGFIDVQSTLSGRFFRVHINPRGMAKHEAIRASGGGWASSGAGSTRGHEFVFGPNEEAEAARLFRDVTEVARTEVLIVDPFARSGIISKLQHVPKGVKIRILTSSSMATEDYTAELQSYPGLDIEIRVLPKGDLEFHDRYIIVDDDDAWGWGHSFHDAGKTKHTVAQIRPVNRDRILMDFRQKWPKGRVVV